MASPITEYQPSAGLQPFVEAFWEGNFWADESHPLTLRVIPKGSVELIIHLNEDHCQLYHSCRWSRSPDFLLMGLYSNPYEVHFERPVKVFSIRFKPEGLFTIFGIPAALFKERFEDMSLVMGTGFQDFSERLREEKNVASMIRQAECYLNRNLTGCSLELNYINTAAELIRKTSVARICELADLVNISRRQLERGFKEILGISPKQYLRIIRLNQVQRLLKENRQMSLTSVAYHCGYCDQAHFIRDFESFIGVAPTTFLKSMSGYISKDHPHAIVH